MVVRTRLLPSFRGDLLDLLPTPDGVCAWVRDGDGLVGWGEAARVQTFGASRYRDAAQWWQQLCARAQVQDEVGAPGSGLVAFASMAFSDSPGSSALVVPQVVVGRRHGRTWITEIDAGAGAPGVDAVSAAGPVVPVTAPRGLHQPAGTDSVVRWRGAVAEAVRRIRGGELQKVVLARDLHLQAAAPLDSRYVLARLARSYPQCWTFAVDGLVGATPELLVRLQGEEVSSRVLAGTTWPRPDSTSAELAAELLASPKNTSEHRYAVTSLLESLRSVCTEVQADDVQVLQLPNVAHLSTTVRARLARSGAGVLELAEALHPTAAVGGTPTSAATALIAELEDMDRGRYAAPVGWVDAAGNGELGLALRSAEIAGPRARLFAGGGIVAESDPDDEVNETDAKLSAVRDALQAEQ